MVGPLEAVANSKIRSLLLRSVQSNRVEKTHIDKLISNTFLKKAIKEIPQGKGDYQMNS